MSRGFWWGIYPCCRSDFDRGVFRKRTIKQRLKQAGIIPNIMWEAKGKKKNNLQIADDLPELSVDDIECVLGENSTFAGGLSKADSDDMSKSLSNLTQSKQSVSFSAIVDCISAPHMNQIPAIEDSSSTLYSSNSLSAKPTNDYAENPKFHAKPSCNQLYQSSLPNSNSSTIQQSGSFAAQGSCPLASINTDHMYKPNNDCMYSQQPNQVNISQNYMTGQPQHNQQSYGHNSNGSSSGYIQNYYENNPRYQPLNSGNYDTNYINKDLAVNPMPYHQQDAANYAITRATCVQDDFTSNQPIASFQNYNSGVLCDNYNQQYFSHPSDFASTSQQQQATVIPNQYQHQFCDPPTAAIQQNSYDCVYSNAQNQSSFSTSLHNKENTYQLNSSNVGSGSGVFSNTSTSGNHFSYNFNQFY